MIGQKFVYKFVSFPEILKMDPQAVEMGLASGRFPMQEGEESEPEVEEDEEEAAAEEEAMAVQRRSLAAALGARQCRNEYLRSGLYSSFSINSLHKQPELLRALRERHDESRSVIRFGNQACDGSSLSKLQPPASPLAKSLLKRSPAAEEKEEEEQREEEDEEDCDQSSQPLNLSSSHRERAALQQPPRGSSSRSTSSSSSSSSTSSSSSQGDGLPPKNKKPKALEISGPSLLLAGSDIGSIALNSPALPSGSLTPAFFTTQVSTTHLAVQAPMGTHISEIEIWMDDIGSSISQTVDSEAIKRIDDSIPVHLRL